MGNILEVRGLVKRFGGLVAVNNLNLDIQEGQITALIGPNGSGKTTTVNLLTRAFEADAGEITYYGDNAPQEITDLPEHQVARIGMRRTYQNIRLYRSMNALDNVKVGYQHDDQGVMAFLLNRRKARREEQVLTDQALAMLEYVGLEGIGERMVGDLPYGMQKKLEIAKALISQPKLIFLDEPATGLNPNERSELIQLIFKIRQSKKSVFIIEHNMDVVMGISDHINVLNFGTLIAKGTPAEIQSNEDVIAAYLGSQYMKDGKFEAH